jgi:hypothetical protein
MAVRRPALARLAVAALAAPAALSLGACEYDRTTIAQGAPQLAVHAVLNPGAAGVSVLVEYVLSGRITVRQAQSFDALDPIVSGGGDPVRGARVVIYGPLPGDSAVATEGTGSGGRGAGVYRVQSAPTCGALQPACVALVPGGRYRLRVTGGGREVTGETTIPVLAGPQAPPQERVFDRETDTLALSWSAVEGARRYALRVESPRGPFTAFLADTS